MTSTASPIHVVILLALGACSSSAHTSQTPDAAPSPEASSANADDPTPGTPTQPVAAADAATQSDAWWQAADAPCPAGSRLVGAAPPQADLIGCKTDKGVNEGRMTRFHANGKKAEEANYHEHRADGVLTEWDADGHKRRQVAYQNGSKEGVETEWNPAGVVTAQRHYHAGKRHGLSRVWHPSGKQGLETPYSEGQPDGIETHWDANGRVLKLVRWEHGTQRRVYQYRYGKPLR